MKKTFDLLVKLKNKHLKLYDKSLLNFVAQLQTDFNEFISKGEYDLIGRAERQLNAVADLESSAPYLSKMTLKKIEALYNLFHESQSGDIRQAAAMLLEMYMALDTELKKRQARCVIQNIGDYEAHLKRKMAENGLVIGENGMILSFNSTEDLLPLQDTLILRYYAVAELYNQFKNKKHIEDVDVKQIKDTLQVCHENQSDWFEKPFFQKVEDVVFFRIKPAYIAFFSTEARINKKIEQQILRPGV